MVPMDMAPHAISPPTLEKPKKTFGSTLSSMMIHKSASLTVKTKKFDGPSAADAPVKTKHIGGQPENMKTKSAAAPKTLEQLAGVEPWEGGKSNGKSKRNKAKKSKLKRRSLDLTMFMDDEGKDMPMPRVTSTGVLPMPMRRNSVASNGSSNSISIKFSKQPSNGKDRSGANETFPDFPEQLQKMMWTGDSVPLPPERRRGHSHNGTLDASQHSQHSQSSLPLHHNHKPNRRPDRNVLDSSYRSQQSAQSYKSYHLEEMAELERELGAMSMNKQERQHHSYHGDYKQASLNKHSQPDSLHHSTPKLVGRKQRSTKYDHANHKHEASPSKQNKKPHHRRIDANAQDEDFASVGSDPISEPASSDERADSPIPSKYQEHRHSSHHGQPREKKQRSRSSDFLHDLAHSHDSALHQGSSKHSGQKTMQRRSSDIGHQYAYEEVGSATKEARSPERAKQTHSPRLSKGMHNHLYPAVSGGRRLSPHPVRGFVDPSSKQKHQGYKAEKTPSSDVNSPHRKGSNNHCNDLPEANVCKGGLDALNTMSSNSPTKHSLQSDGSCATIHTLDSLDAQKLETAEQLRELIEMMQAEFQKLRQAKVAAESKAQSLETNLVSTQQESEAEYVRLSKEVENWKRVAQQEKLKSHTLQSKEERLNTLEEKCHLLEDENRRLKKKLKDKPSHQSSKQSNEDESVMTVDSSVATTSTASSQFGSQNGERKTHYNCTPPSSPLPFESILREESQSLQYPHSVHVRRGVHHKFSPNNTPQAPASWHGGKKKTILKIPVIAPPLEKNQEQLPNHMTHNTKSTGVGHYPTKFRRKSSLSTTSTYSTARSSTSASLRDSTLGMPSNEWDNLYYEDHGEGGNPHKDGN